MPHLTYPAGIEREMLTFYIQVEAFKNVPIAYLLSGQYDRGVRQVVVWSLYRI